MTIPKPTGSLVLKIRSPKVHTFQTFHSAADGVLDSQVISEVGCMVVGETVCVAVMVDGDAGRGIFCGLVVEIGEVDIGPVVATDGSWIEPSR
jgi:hypothetical protein